MSHFSQKPVIQFNCSDCRTADITARRGADALLTERSYYASAAAFVIMESPSAVAAKLAGNDRGHGPREAAPGKSSNMKKLRVPFFALISGTHPTLMVSVTRLMSPDN
jgi:hypothetical protein